MAIFKGEKVKRLIKVKRWLRPLKVKRWKI